MLKLSAISLILTAIAGAAFHNVGAIHNVRPTGHWEPSHETEPLVRPVRLNAPAVPEFGLDIHANRPHTVHLPHLQCGPWMPMLGRVGGKPNPFYGNVQRCEVM